MAAGWAAGPSGAAWPQGRSELGPRRTGGTVHVASWSPGAEGDWPHCATTPLQAPLSSRQPQHRHQFTALYLGMPRHSPRTIVPAAITQPSRKSPDQQDRTPIKTSSSITMPPLLKAKPCSRIGEVTATELVVGGSRRAIRRRTRARPYGCRLAVQATPAGIDDIPGPIIARSAG